MMNSNSNKTATTITTTTVAIGAAAAAAADNVAYTQDEDEECTKSSQRESIEPGVTDLLCSGLFGYHQILAR